MSRRSWENQAGDGSTNGTGSDNTFKTERHDQHDGMSQQATRLVLTKEELQVLEQCKHDSFFYRCLPLGLVFIGTTQILTNKGILTPHRKYGALFKNIAAGFAAFVIGKLSYQGICRHRIMQLENSSMAEAMKKGKRGPEILQDMLLTEQKKNDQNSFQSDSSDSSERPDIFGMSSGPQRKEPKSETKQPVTYDDLRQQHRKEFEQKQAPHDHDIKQPYYYKTPQTTPPPSSPSPPPDQTDDFSVKGNRYSGKGSKRNKYGDDIE